MFRHIANLPIYHAGMVKLQYALRFPIMVDTTGKDLQYAVFWIAYGEQKRFKAYRKFTIRVW